MTRLSTRLATAGWTDIHMDPAIRDYELEAAEEQKYCNASRPRSTAQVDLTIF